MAILKLTKIRNKDYYNRLQYMIVQSNDSRTKFLVDNYGSLIPRDNYSLRLYDPTGARLPVYCWEEYAYTSDYYYNNSYDKNEINMLQIIIRFEEEYVEYETMFEIAELFIKRYLRGQLVLSAGHDSQHIHLLVKRLRLLDIEPCEEWMEKDKEGRIKPCEYKAGCRLRVGRKKLNHMKAYIMELCRERGLAQIDLLKKKPERKTQIEYEMTRRGVQSKRGIIKKALDEVRTKARSNAEIKEMLSEQNITMVRHNGIIKYIVGNEGEPISGGSLGEKYKIENILLDISIHTEKDLFSEHLKKKQEQEMFTLNWYSRSNPEIEYRISMYNEDGSRRTLLESLVTLAIVLIEGEIPEWVKLEKKYIKPQKEIEKLNATLVFLRKHKISTIEELDAFCNDNTCSLQAKMEGIMAKRHILEIKDSHNYRKKVDDWCREISSCERDGWKESGLQVTR